MKIALIGYGKMGQEIEQIAIAKGHRVSVRFSRGLGTLKERRNELRECDIAIDFSHADAVIDHLRLCLSLKKPLVIGTTGWETQLPEAKAYVEQENGSCLYAPNFSIGIYLFGQIVAHAASLFASFPDYDVAGIERHHRKKADSPSGTAKGLSRNILNLMPRLNALDFSSIRCGHSPGTHTLYFDSPFDTITLTHEAHSRQSFAQGALMAAEWLMPLQGFFTLEDMIKGKA